MIINFVCKHYNSFIEKNGYIPKFFNPYNETEIKNIVPTQSTQCGSTTSSATVLVKEGDNMNNLRIRKLTPKECWRLMGFDDSDFEKAEKINSNTQLYKQAGNSIVVNVLERILENLIDKDEHIKILELFGGIGACSKALEKLGIDYEIADYVEIDKYAVASFNAIHNTNFEPQDICKWDKDIDVDLIMHGSPCQDFSLAGLQAGGDEGSGTRSSLMYETVRIVEKLKPKYVIWENVKNVISKKHKHNFNNYLDRMEELGYTNYYQVLNAKDYGIPQNRERVFTISMRTDIWLKHGSFWFPPKQELKLKLKDMLEDNVDKKYYLSDKMIQYISVRGTENFKNPDCKINLDIARPLTTDPNKRAGTTNYLSDQLPSNYNLIDMEDDKVKEIGYIEKGTGQHQSNTVYDIDGLCLTICSAEAYKSPYKFLIKNATKKGYLEATDGDGIDISSRMQYHRGNVQKDSIQTITTSGGNERGVVVKDFEIDLSCLD